VEVIVARRVHVDAVTASIVLEAHVHRLVQVTHPVAQRLEKPEPLLGVFEEAEVAHVVDGRSDDALVRRRARSVAESQTVPGQVHEVLAGANARMVGPAACLGEDPELAVQRHELDHRGASRRCQLLERDLTDDLMPEVAPRECPCRVEAGGCRHNERNERKHVTIR
jgi:hypothetical protein